MQVRDPEGRDWMVRRQWLPRHENVGTRILRERRERRAQRRSDRERRRSADPSTTRWFDWFDVPSDGVGLAIVGVVAVVLLLLWGWPLLLALLDVLFVLLLAVCSVVARLVLRRPWLIEATSGEARLTRQAVGWRASGRTVRTWAEELRHGRGLEPPVL
ncbi:MAG: hypothetical protein JWN67_2559 [Actinomycetia bacterium]|nr:hypothetical protein [Actinomycetes bacterium]